MDHSKVSGKRVAAALKGLIPAHRLKTDPLYTYAYSGDASYFRLIPALVVIVDTEDEVRAVMAEARKESLPVTFRAAGTSLCGQAITDGVLCVLGDGWNNLSISENGEKATLGPAIIVADANAALRVHDRKIGPDPASQAACKIGGVVSNNSSGMCCGVAQNTYHTMDRLRLILSDGTLLDSADPASRKSFSLCRPDIVEGLAALGAEVRKDNELVDLIRRKYEIKNTVGYSLNALIDFTDPIDILTHLMVGSEGTLGFISEITYNTVPDHPHKATALVPFSTNHKAAEGVQALHEVGVSAAEFMERKALTTVEHLPAMVPFVPMLSTTSPAVLIEIMAENPELLDKDIKTACDALIEVGALSIPQFTKDPDVQLGLWDVRKGLFASAGASRPKGSVMLTEDVAVPIDRLADAVDDLRLVFDKHGYTEGIIFGHALAGNLHFQMHADFTNAPELERFEAFTADLARLVSVDYQGSLKAEHGTGRAIAPFVEQEWGEKAYSLMFRIKNLFDKELMLNPGVILNDNAKIHVQNTKQMVASDDLVDLCIECGLCEAACPSAGLTLSPRQRIAMIRETTRLDLTGENDELAKALEQGFVHAGMDTCAGCNLCATRCPIGIETGSMILGKRQAKRSGFSNAIAGLAANNTAIVEKLAGAAVGAQSLIRKLAGDKALESATGTLNKISGGKAPRVSKNLRPGPGVPPEVPQVPDAPRGDVIYFPACASRMFGPPQTELDLLPVTDAMIALLQRAGFNPVVPQDLKGLCCGQPFLSKGFPGQAQEVGARLNTALASAVSGTPAPLYVTDTSTCALHMKNHNTPVFDSAEFLATLVLPHLSVNAELDIVAVHHNCSAQHQNEKAATEKLARACAKEIAVLGSVTCCGYAGDKGLFQPELNAHALRFAPNDVPEGCTIGVSTVATCAIGLSDYLQIPFVSLASMLEFVTRPERAPATE